jgi:Domain of unknown function (DUF4928)
MSAGDAPRVKLSTDDIRKRLATFTARKSFRGKGPLSVALVVTQHARSMGLPLDARKLITEGGGQVLGLGKGAVQAVLKRHGIDRLLASEGGRTSRGSLQNMREYVDFVNDLNRRTAIDLDVVENFWIDRVKEFFAGKPFKIKLDTSKSLRAVVRDVIMQAEERQRSMPGVYYAGAVLQHLVGAKLDCALGKGKFQHNNFTTADSPGSRSGDFFLGDVAIHVTTSPGEAVIQRCSDNLNDDIRPVLVTIQRGLTVAEGLANNVKLGDRIDIFEIEQFVALNIYELGGFAANGRKMAVADIVSRYNEIIDLVETDPSLKIELRR